jgi:hypothetical protein
MSDMCLQRGKNSAGMNLECVLDKGHEGDCYGREIESSSMKLMLVDNEGVLLDEVDVDPDEFDYAQIDGGAATLLLGSLHPGRLD